MNPPTRSRSVPCNVVEGTIFPHRYVENDGWTQYDRSREDHYSLDDSLVEIRAARSGRVNSNDTGERKGPRLRICQDSLARRVCRYLGKILFAIVKGEMSRWSARKWVLGQLDSSWSPRRRASSLSSSRSSWDVRDARGFRWTEDGRRRARDEDRRRQLLLVSHPILVTLSFLAAGWRLYRVTVLFLGRPTLSALREAVGGLSSSISHVRVFRTRT